MHLHPFPLPKAPLLHVASGMSKLGLCFFNENLGALLPLVFFFSPLVLSFGVFFLQQL